MRHSTPKLLRHALVIGSFALATTAWMWPMVRRFGVAIPGAAAGDNVTFLWNVWWVRYAVTHQIALLSTPMLLYPYGADLTLHTHTALPSLAVSFVRNPVLAQNLLVLAHLFLNFACTYLLAWRETRSLGPALVAAVIFACSPYLAAHLTGHFNLIAAWVLPLSALLTSRAIEDPRGSRGVWLGIGLGAIAYVDYYYFVYACLLAVLIGLASFASVPRRPLPIAHRAAAVTMSGLGVLAVAALAAAATIALSGGWVWQIDGRTISVRSIRNPIAAAWLCGLLALGIHFIRTRTVRFDSPLTSRLARPAFLALVVLVIVLGPLLRHAAETVRAGTYVSQQYLWRSAPAGVDLMTLLGGNPSSALYGRFVRPTYHAWSVNLVEHVGWITPGVIALALIGVMTAPGRRWWLLPLVVFGVWAIGPSLQTAGHSSPLWMPAVLVRWIPIVANARIPARAMVVVYLACAMLAAHGMRQLMLHRRPAVAWALFALVLVDLAPAPPPVFTLPRPAIVEAMTSDPVPGAVLHVPFGLRDGFGETGQLDPEAMWLQTIHHRPLAGGFVARLPRGVADRYREMPVLGSLLRLSSGERLAESQVAADRATADSLIAVGFRYVVVNRRLAAPELQHYIDRVLSTPAALQDAQYTVYLLGRSRAHPNPGGSNSS